MSEWVHTLVSMFSVSSNPHKQEKTTPQQAATPITPPLTFSSHPEAASSQLPRKPVLDSRVDKESDAEGAEDINTEAGQVRSVGVHTQWSACRKDITMWEGHYVGGALCGRCQTDSCVLAYL